MTPSVEVWRAGATLPQIPKRHGYQLEEAYIAGSNPVTARLQFDPLESGEIVLVRAAKGVTLDPSGNTFRIRPTGELVLSVSLDETVSKGHIIFHRAGVTTALELKRAPLTKVMASESASTGGAQ
jgi:hypothetical protein